MKKLTLVLTDLVAFYGSLALVLLVRYGPSRWDAAYDLHVGPFSILFLVWLFSFYIANLYEERVLRAGSDFYGRLIQAVIVAAVISVLFFYLIPYFVIAPKLNLFLFIVVFAFVWAGARTLANKSLAAGSKKRLLLVGMNDESLELARFIDQNPQFGYSVRAFARFGQEALFGDATALPWPVIEDLPGVDQLIADRRVDVAVISAEAYGNTHIIDLLYRSLGQDVTFKDFATFYEQLTGRVPSSSIDRVWFLHNLDSSATQGYATLKRVMDIVVGLVLGTASLVLYPFIMAALMFDEGSGIFSVQERVGYRNQPIRVYKFRTMLIADDKGAWGSAQNRVTAVGNFLRRTRLDELPQLWNILAGSLSLVGPRPEFRTAVESYKNEVPHYDIRHLVKPGLSGWAQIHHRQHPHHMVDAEETRRKLEYDLYYLKRRSFALDLEIILKTVSIALRREGR